MTRSMFVGDWDCHGIAHGSVTLVMTTGPDTSGPPVPLPYGGFNISRLVGRFSFRVP